MLTHIEIDGFKSFEGFSLNLNPLTAIVGPNASGKSNLFDALRFISLLAQFDIRTAMQDLRGEPRELFRTTARQVSDTMTFAVEILLSRSGEDAFGTKYETPAQRIRYELSLGVGNDVGGHPQGIYVRREECKPIARKDDQAAFLKRMKISYNSRVAPFIRVSDTGDALLIRQDGRQKHGRPMQLPLREASKTALSTITTAEFPHLYAVKEALSNVKFLEIVPQAARAPSDRFEDRALRRDASNLAAVLARLRQETASEQRPDGVLADIGADLSSLIPSAQKIKVIDDPNNRQYAFGIDFSDGLSFSSRVISDGTLRLLALLTILNDPQRSGTLCFEEPENGVHEGRIKSLVDYLRASVAFSAAHFEAPFQVILNTHSPKVMSALRDEEIVASDSVSYVEPRSGNTAIRTRMRSGILPSKDLFDPEHNLSRAEVERLLQHNVDAA
jgi:predicted ATPase